MRIFLIILLTANTIFVCFAQTNSPAVIMSSGTYTAGDEASLSWTIGESLIESYSEESTTLLQGFNETGDFEEAAVEDSFEDAGVLVFPTYTHTFISVYITREIKEACIGELIDINGKVLSVTRLHSNINEVNLEEYTYGMYLLIIKEGDKSLTETMIIKY